MRIIYQSIKIMNKKAFTIIELLIAMIIFGIWILVVVSVLNHNVLLSKTLSLKTRATMFAKEWMELVFNIRDSNNLQYKKRNCYMDCHEYSDSGFLWKLWKTWTNYRINLNIVSYIPQAREISDLSESQIYTQTWAVTGSSYNWFRYSYYLTWSKKTPFRRYVNFEDVRWLDASSSWKILKLNSISSYQFWWITWSIELSSFLSDWK